MAFNAYWSRANINSSSSSYGLLSLNKNLATHRPSSSYWSTSKSIASIGRARGSSYQPAGIRSFSSPTEAREKRQKFDRDVIVSVLESTATRRDAKGYLQKYAAPKLTSPASASSTQVEHQLKSPARQFQTQPPFNVAIVVLRNPQKLPQDTIKGIAKTLTQLRALGLLSVVVVDCGTDESRFTFQHEALRLCEAVDSFDEHGSKLVENLLVGTSHFQKATPSPFWDDIQVQDYGILNRALQHNMIAVIPSLARNNEIMSPVPADVQRTALALTRYFTGLQFEEDSSNSQDGSYGGAKDPLASVERVIILDQFGGIPMTGRPDVYHRFINLEQEYNTLLDQLEGDGDSKPQEAEGKRNGGPSTSHARNLNLAKDTLSLLPETASVLITSPLAASNTSSASSALTPARDSKYQLGFDGMVTTRRRQNLLLHNLLTDKPIYSPSLPFQRIQSPKVAFSNTGESISATLVKRGMPLTIYPDPRISPWKPAAPGERGPQLTDKSIDLPRLVTLIEDSFGRKLDVEDYLRRTNENLAGVIIAGEYEGCAILTWERPKSIDPQRAYDEGRYVPYLDKFAVLRSRQGSGGVADIVFNAMVRDCFPDGVIWRSRKDNPVNKWYFERSVGTSKLSNCNWAMFWTTLELSNKSQKLEDYEEVCREIMPSWADNIKKL
ncbi:hypothetical protein HDV63DRAFT_375564, partial [Trichoderma sp. SZMC 28014]